MRSVGACNSLALAEQLALMDAGAGGAGLHPAVEQRLLSLGSGAPSARQTHVFCSRRHVPFGCLFQVLHHLQYIHILSAIHHARTPHAVKAAIYIGSQATITRAANHLKLLLHVALQNAQELLLAARAVRARRRRKRAPTRLMRPSLSASASWNISSRTFCSSVRRSVVCMAGGLWRARHRAFLLAQHGGYSAHGRVRSTPQRAQQPGGAPVQVLFGYVALVVLVVQGEGEELRGV